MLIDDVTAILLISPNAKKLCEFYRATLGLPLEEEVHDGIPLHYGYSLGRCSLRHPPRRRLAGSSNEERPEPGHHLQHLQSEGGGRTLIRQRRQGDRTDRPRFWPRRFVSRSRWEFCFDPRVRAGVLVSSRPDEQRRFRAVCGGGRITLDDDRRTWRFGISDLLLLSFLFPSCWRLVRQSFEMICNPTTQKTRGYPLRFPLFPPVQKTPRPDVFPIDDLGLDQGIRATTRIRVSRDVA